MSPLLHEDEALFILSQIIYCHNTMIVKDPQQVRR